MDVQDKSFELFTTGTCSLDVHRKGIPFTTINTRMDVQGVPLFYNARMSYCPASTRQSVTGMNKNAHPETSPVPE